ncbi:insulinoma-associated protein 1a [Lingula anatina]|uniref:Insulinoma-associated protein 1a n=1 Tax=Lingula anatina TaxID=7574 RepID=A0A1S3IR28_LINAN|nr:insulinoma-associated protein 1a [Lingula anatina]|eukprot:XP_013400004.1 insulinoma-associated protein 1a [Lingula anatina]
MPRGFLVKRHYQCGSAGGLQAHQLETSRLRRNSEEDRSDSGSEHDYVSHDTAQSPDSGFSASPLALTTRDRSASPGTRETPPEPRGSQLRPLSSLQPYYVPSNLSYYHNTASTYSPFYFSSFDRLSVTSPTGKNIVTDSVVPQCPNKKRSNDSISKPKPNRKSKAARRLNFSEVKNSPVSGTFIRDSDDEDTGGDIGTSRVVRGDIDGSLNFVEVTEEAKNELAKIENKIGDYICQLCKEWFEDAFRLAQHRCSRIVHIEYRCPECDKVFNCPANLASHRRWHKPRPNSSTKVSAPSKILPAPPAAHDHDTPLNLAVKDRVNPSLGTPATTAESEALYSCDKCDKKFRRRAYLVKHLQTHQVESSEPAPRRVEPERPYPCRYCGQVLPSEEYLAKHLLQHNDEVSVIPSDRPRPPPSHLPNGTPCVQPDFLYKCKHCTSVFYTSAALTRHINKRHPSDTKQVILLNLPTPEMNRQ